MEPALAHLRRAQARAKSIGRVELEAAPLIRQARVDFGSFCEAIGKPNAEHHKLWVREFVTGFDSSQLLHCAGPNTAVLAPRGPLDVDTPVATPSGWKPLKDVQVGDQVFAADGTATTVLAAVDYPSTECWEVVMSDGTSVICDDSHRWDVRRMGTDAKGEWRTVTLQEIRQFVTVGTQGNWRTGVSRVVRLAEEGEKPWLLSKGSGRYEVPMAAAVAYPIRSLPLDPYLLGVLLGNDSFTRDQVHLAQQALVDLGLWGLCAHEKFIPDAYLCASIQQREALLQGLLDTGGTIVNSSIKVEPQYCSSSPRLIAGVEELVRSLGGIAKRWKPEEEMVPQRRTAHRLGIRLPDGIQPFRCSAKKSRYEGIGARSLTRTIVDIRPAGMRPVRCITVEHKSELFIVKDYLAVKNSAKSTLLGMLVAWLIGIHTQEKRMLRMLYLGYSLDIARSRSHTIKAIIGSRIYREIFPMVRLSANRQSDELWSIDYDFAGIEAAGDDPYTLVGQGLSGSITSRRSQLIVLDDVIKSSEAISNPEIRRKLITNYSEVVAPTLLEGGRCIALGTRFSTVDIFQSTFNQKNGWKVVTQQAITTDDHGVEHSYWPEFYSLEHLKKLRAEDPISFSFQFQNSPVSRSEVDFPDDWLKLADLSNTYDSLCVGIDLSSALKERNDWTVMTLAGIIGDRVEVIDYRRMRVMGNLEKIDALCELLADWGILIEGEEKPDGTRDWHPTDINVTINIEAISYQQSMQADAKTTLHDKRALHNLVLRGITGYRGDKLTRFRGTFGLFQTGRVTWNRWINWEPFHQEMKNFGSTDHDDCPDSFLLAVRGLIGAGRLQPAWGEWADGGFAS